MSSIYINIPSFGSGYWKDPVSTATALPMLGNMQGDVRVTLDTDAIYIWSGAAWVTATAGTGVASLNGLAGALSLVAGSGITVTPGTNTISIASTGGGGSGTVTSVSLVDSTGLFNITGSPVTVSGALTLSSLVNQSANTFLAAPNGSSGAPSFRAVVAADIPTLNQNTTGTASNITASSNSTLTTLTVLSLPGSQVSGNISGNAANINATSNSTLVTLSALSLPYSQLSGTVPTWNQNTTGTAANITATSNSTLTTLTALSLPTSQLSGQVSLSQLPTIANNTILGNNSGSSATPLALTPGQVNAILPVFTSTLNGLVPLSGGGTSNYLRADGSFAVPPGTGITAAITSINADTTAAQTIVAASTGTDFTISTASGATTITIPTASASARGLVNVGVQTLSGQKTFDTAILAPNGTSSLPSYAFSSDSTTGIHDGGGSLSLTIQGADALTLAKSSGGFGNLGMGGPASTSDSYPILIQRSITSAGVNAQISNTSTSASAKASWQLAADNGNNNGEVSLFTSATALAAYANAMTVRPSNSTGMLSLIGGDLSTGYVTTFTGGDYTATGETIRFNADHTNQLMQSVTTPTTPGAGLKYYNNAGVFTSKNSSGVVASFAGSNSGDVTLGTANGLSLSGQALSLGTSSTSTTGALTSTDWNTFNGKQAAGNYVTRSISTVTSATNAGSAANTDYVYFVNASIITSITLPTAVSNTNLYTIKSIGTAQVSINTTSSQTIDGSTTVLISVTNTSLDLISDGANWRIV